MMKNSEWGAVSYLQHSKYGSQMSIRINNNSDFITGYASVSEPTCGLTNDNRDCNKHGTTSDITLPYNTETGYLASTTGNITGIYDISGGSFEYVMGVMTDEDGNPLSGRNTTYNSGFTGNFGEGGSNASGLSWPEEKYYDKYSYGTNASDYTRGHLGDATVEMGPFKSIFYITDLERQISSWYSNRANFLNIEDPWLARGGSYNYGSESGIFSFSRAHSANYDYISFRITLII